MLLPGISLLDIAMELKLLLVLSYLNYDKGSQGALNEIPQIGFIGIEEMIK